MPMPFDPAFRRAAFWAASAAALLTALAFAAAMVAVPPAGPYCRADCRAYPYLDTLDLYPHDYVWLPLAMLATLSLALLALVLDMAAGRRLAARTALAAALLSAAVLLPTYAVQLSAVPASLAAGETEGLAFVTMYNGNGAFIALEKLGYGLMSFSFLGLALLLPWRPHLLGAARALFALGFFVPLAGLIWYAAAYGLGRSYRFEVLIIGTDWTALILAALALAVAFGRRG